MDGVSKIWKGDEEPFHLKKGTSANTKGTPTPKGITIIPKNFSTKRTSLMTLPRLTPEAQVGWTDGCAK